MLHESAKLATWNDWAIYGLAVCGGFIGENWYEIGFFAFAALHAYIAWDKHRFEKSTRAD